MKKSSNTQVIYAPSAYKDLERLDRVIYEKIVRKIAQNSQSHAPLSNAKKLKGEYQGYYRYRIGDYRAVFEYDTKGQVRVIMILKIGHRKHIY